MPKGSNSESATEKRLISNGFDGRIGKIVRPSISGFASGSNFLTVQDGQPCETPKNQSPRIPHEYE